MTIHLDRRGAFLIIVGIIQVIIGWAILVGPPQGSAVLHMARYIGAQPLGWIQIVLAAAAIINAFWPPGRDRFGFMVTFPVPLFWGLDYLITTVAGEFPFGYAAGVRAVVFWWGYAALILLVSGMVGVREYRDGRQ